MNFEPQCKTRADLYREMARVLDMCEAAGFDRPWECVKFDGGVCTHINLDYDPASYEFFLCFVEGRPVFRGDVLYIPSGVDTSGRTIVSAYEYAGGWSLQWIEQGETLGLPLHGWSWNPPKPKTITVNGVKVKAPDEISAPHIESGWITLRFKTKNVAEAFKAALEGKE